MVWLFTAGFPYAPIRSKPVMQAPIRSRPVMLSVVMFLVAVGSVSALFMRPVRSVIICSDLHDKGLAATYPGTGQQTGLDRPVGFEGFLKDKSIIN